MKTPPLGGVCAMVLRCENYCSHRLADCRMSHVSADRENPLRFRPLASRFLDSRRAGAIQVVRWLNACTLLAISIALGCTCVWLVEAIAATATNYISTQRQARTPVCESYGLLVESPRLVEGTPRRVGKRRSSKPIDQILDDRVYRSVRDLRSAKRLRGAALVFRLDLPAGLRQIVKELVFGWNGNLRSRWSHLCFVRPFGVI